MNGIHDMGGMHGYGPVDPSDASPFHSDWERRVFALVLAASAHLRSNLDQGRFQLESLPPEEYLRGYFERWYARLLEQGVAAGLLDAPARVAIERGERPEPRTRDHEPLPAAAFLHVAATGSPVIRESTRPPIFAPGDAVRARNIHPETHTRLPGYVRGHVGTVVAHHGVHVFPDSNAQLLGEDPQHLYGVRFAASALWGERGGEGASDRDTVTLDLFEPYLEPAP